MFGEICDCHCHYNKNVKHIVSCCITCPSCDGKIRSVNYNGHVKRCVEEAEERLKKLIAQYKKSE